MLQFRKNILKKPIEGWHYLEGEHKIVGESPEDVEQKLFDFRIRNGMPPGDPHGDMIKFWFIKSPEFVEHGSGDADGSARIDSGQLGGVLLWLQRLIQQGPDLEIGPGVAEQRASICAHCPCNVPLSGDPGIKSEVDRRSFILRKGEIVPSLHFCSHHHIDLRVAVRLRNEFLAQSPTQPAHCWVKR